MSAGPRASSKGGVPPAAFEGPRAAGTHGDIREGHA